MSNTINQCREMFPEIDNEILELIVNNNDNFDICLDILIELNSTVNKPSTQCIPCEIDDPSIPTVLCQPTAPLIPTADCQPSAAVLSCENEETISITPDTSAVICTDNSTHFLESNYQTPLITEIEETNNPLLQSKND